MRRFLKGLGIVVCGVVAVLALLVALATAGVIGPPKVSPDVIASSVDQRAADLDKAFALPVAARYGRPLYWQSNGSTCGPASLVNVFRSLGDEVSDEDAVLDGTGKCSLGLCFMGLTLDELADVARAQDARKVTVARDLSPEAFREHLRRSNDPGRRVIINFSRKPIFGSGGGHHSPIGGYLESADLVLVLDVNAHYRPWLIDRSRLFAAMDTLDGSVKRGLLIIE